MTDIDLQKRSEMASLLRYDVTLGMAGSGARHAQPTIQFPQGMTPSPQPDSDETLRSWFTASPRIIVMVDTADEAAAAAAVFTPGIPAQGWHPYNKNFYRFQDQLTDKSPARRSHRLGSYYFTKIKDVHVLIYKTELHMHEDGPSVPLKDMLRQLIAEYKPTHFLTTGTAGGVSDRLALGGVTISQCVRFICKRTFADAPFNNKVYRSRLWGISPRYLGTAEALMKDLADHLTGVTPPRSSCAAAATNPTIIYSNLPTLTTDYFEFGTTKNQLDLIGCCVEMDDAVLGLLCYELQNEAPFWASIRNVSDPVINGELPSELQDQCAEFYYKNYGYWTSINSALAAWAVCAGLKE